MKKITFLFLFITSVISAQVNLQDFAVAQNVAIEDNYGGFGGELTASLEAAPDDAANQVGKFETTAGGDIWKGIFVRPQSYYIDLTTTKTVSVKVYSTTALYLKGKIQAGTSAQTDIELASAEAHTGSGWETLTFTFTNATGEWYEFVLFANVDSSGAFINPATQVLTVYIDDVTAVQGSAIPAPDPDPAPAPLPTAADNETYNIYNDTNSYTTNFPYAYDFGTIGGEPDLDTNTTENKALKFDFSVAGYGQGEGGPDDVSGYDYVNFMYWAVSGVPGFQFRMISNDGGVQEYTYEIGTDEAIVTEAWTQVSIPMSYFTNLGFSSTHLFQWKFDAFMQVVTNPGVVYVDNIILTQNPLSVKDYQVNTFNVFPNPTTNNWNVKASQIVDFVQVFDVLGKSVYKKEVNSTNFTIDSANLKTGLYFAKLSSSNGSSTIKLVKE